MAITVLGKQIAQQGQRIERTKDGKFIVRIFTGTREAIYGYVASLPPETEWEVDDTDNLLLRLTIRSPDDGSDTGMTQDSETTWELFGNELQKDIYESPLAMLTPENVIKAIRENVEKVIDGELTYQQGLTNVWTAVQEATGLTTEQRNTLRSDASALFDHLFRRGGNASYLDSQYVLRLTQTIGPRYSRQLSDENVNRVYTLNQLKTETTNNQVPIPERMLYKIERIPSRSAYYADGTENPYYLWGWLKKPSTETQIAGGKIQVVTEWWLELWFTYNYFRVTNIAP